MLTTLAAQAAVAIDNARLVNDLQQSLSDLKNTQAALVQSEKLSAIGQLIAGVAHELNNPLTAVMGYAQLLQTNDVDDEVRRDLDRIYTQAQRAAKIVQNLLTFARQHKAQRELVDVNELIERVIELRAYQLHVDNIEVTLDLADAILETVADPNQLQQVFLNLINNAQDAISEVADRGRLTIRTELSGDAIRIAFSDTGPGLDMEARRHLFEPFYTTKEVGKGTGLGLSICYGIVSEHEGRIWADNEIDRGATFTVELPIVDELTRHAGPIIKPAVLLDKGMHILVVEDEKDVAGLVQRILATDGHHVTLAKDGQAALDALLARSDEPCDLLISDVKMPGLSGPMLYETLCDTFPNLAKKTIFITGDIMSESTQEFLKTTGVPYLSKPFTVEDLRRRIADILAP